MPGIYNFNDTWNNAGVVFNSIFVNISNGAGGPPVAAAASHAILVQNNGGTVFSVDQSGNLFINALATLSGGISAGNNNILPGSFTNSPPNTQSGTVYTVVFADFEVIFTSAAAVTVTMPSPASFSGRWLLFKETGAGAVSSASANVVPLAGGAAQASILTAAGKFALMTSDGANWIVMMSN